MKRNYLDQVNFEINGRLGKAKTRLIIIIVQEKFLRVRGNPNHTRFSLKASKVFKIAFL